MKLLKTIGKVILYLVIASIVIGMAAWSVYIVANRDKPIHENCTHFDVSTTILSEPLYENNEPEDHT